MVSFLTLWKHKSYTKAAEELCLTQPAVTQHIKALERQYGLKLLQYINKELRLTRAGEIFYQYAQNSRINEQVLARKLKEEAGEGKALAFAATLTIGEFTLAPILGDFIKQFAQYDITMYVYNTERVLKMLAEGKISFALVEGLFNKADYSTRLYKRAPFTLIAPLNHPMKNQAVFLEDLKNETIIIREKGSGSRAILERGLYDKNYTLDNFQKVVEIGNVNVIKNLVKSGTGLSFMYRDAALEEINRGEVAEIHLKDFVIEREFNFITLKNPLMEQEAEPYYLFFMERLEGDSSGMQIP